jgi:hypothetical protein
MVGAEGICSLLAHIEHDDPNQVSKRNKKVTREPKNSNAHSPYIAAIASDFSRELGDVVLEASNMRQAINLWQDSGLNEQEFVGLMYEAKKLTRKYQSRPTWDPLNNKMAYFYATLRDLLGGS